MQPQQPGATLEDRHRITPFGAFLRKTSLDEIPQLFLVLTGRMSIVGPRPLLVRYLPFYTGAELKRHSVKPGITGLAQINGRNNLNWEQRLNFDIEYTRNLSFALDIKILLKSITVVLSSKGLQVDPTSVAADLDEERISNRILISENIILRPMLISDAEQLIIVKNNKEAAASLENDPPEFTLNSMQNWIKKHQANSANLILLIEDIASHIIIGHVGLYNINVVPGVCNFGILIGLPAYWNMGIGRMATEEIIRIAWNTPEIRCIELNALEENVKAISLYKSLGFTIVDLMPDYTTKNGISKDVIKMQLFNHGDFHSIIS